MKQNEKKCFEGATPLVYKNSESDYVRVGSIKHIIGDDKALEESNVECVATCVFVPVLNLPAPGDEMKSVLGWRKVEISRVDVSDADKVAITLIPNTFNLDFESDHIIRCSADQEFAVLSRTDGFTARSAAELSPNELMLFERERELQDVESPLFDEDGEVPLEWMLEDGKTHLIECRKIAKKNSCDNTTDNVYYQMKSETGEEYVVLCNGALAKC